MDATGNLFPPGKRKGSEKESAQKASQSKRPYEITLPESLPGRAIEKCRLENAEYRRKVPIRHGFGVYRDAEDALRVFLHKPDKKLKLQNDGTVYFRILLENVEQYVRKMNWHEFYSAVNPPKPKTAGPGPAQLNLIDVSW